METTCASSHSILLNEIALLKQKKRAEEELLKISLKEFALSLKPLSIIKSSLHELATDKAVKEGLVTAGIKLGTNFAIEKIMGRNRSVKGFLGSILVEQFTASLIAKKLVPFITGTFKQEENSETSR